jgi:hypothetical protein
MCTDIFVRGGSFYLNIRFLSTVDEYATADDATNDTAEV